MPFSRIRWIALGSAALVLAIGYASLTRVVTIMADGHLTTIATRALTVGEAIKASGLQLGTEDKAEPAAWWLLSDGMIINVQRAARVQLIADGKIFLTASAERDPTSLLKNWGVKINDGDRLLLAGRTLTQGELLPEESFLSLEVRRPVKVSLHIGDEVTEFQSSALTLGEALAEQEIYLKASDQLEPKVETLLDGPISVTLFRARPVELTVGESMLQFQTAAATVGEALENAGIALQGLDRSEPSEDQPIPDDRQIRIIRVTENVRLEQKSIPFNISWQQDPEAELGTTSVIQEGIDGVSTTRVRTRFEDEIEVSHYEEENRVVLESRDQINGYGGDVVIRTAIVDGVEIEYWATLTVYVTSYSPCRSGGETCLYGTSSGLPVEKGVVGTYLDWYRAYKGGSIYVPGYGKAVFGDVGSYPDGRPWIDLAYSDADWVGWSQWVTIYFTTPIPAAIPYFLQ